MRGVKIVLYVEHTVDANDLPTALWRFCNNLDPKRDHMLCEVKGTGFKEEGHHNELNLKPSVCMGFDGTRKTKELSLIHISEPTRLLSISYAVFCLKKKK